MTWAGPASAPNQSPTKGRYFLILGCGGLRNHGGKFSFADIKHMATSAVSLATNNMIKIEPSKPGEGGPSTPYSYLDNKVVPELKDFLTTRVHKHDDGSLRAIVTTAYGGTFDCSTQSIDDGLELKMSVMKFTIELPGEDIPPLTKLLIEKNEELAVKCLREKKFKQGLILKRHDELYLFLPWEPAPLMIHKGEGLVVKLAPPDRSKFFPEHKDSDERSG